MGHEPARELWRASQNQVAYVMLMLSEPSLATVSGTADVSTK